MRLLIVGSDYNWSIERFYVKYFKDINKDTILFPAQNFKLEYLKKSLINKILHKLGLSNIYSVINTRLVNLISEYKPDVVLIFKGMEIFPKTLEKLNKAKTLLANYNPDSPFIFSGSGSGNKFVTQGLGFYDIFFTYSLDIKNQLENKFSKPVFLLPFGYEISENDSIDIEAIEEIIEPCFLGNPDKYRASFIKELNKIGIKLNLYGHDWDRYVSSKKNKINSPVYGIDFYKTLKKYRVQLNIMRIHNLESHNMRTFEIAAVGGIQLALNTPEHRMFFKENEEIFLYNNEFDCKSKIIELLNLSQKDAKEIRNNTYQRTIKSNYSYKDRAYAVFDTLNSQQSQ